MEKDGGPRTGRAGPTRGGVHERRGGGRCGARALSLRPALSASLVAMDAHATAVEAGARAAAVVACEEGDWAEAARHLDQLGAVPAPCLWAAVKRGHGHVVAHLLRHGAPPSAPNDAGWTPLHRACGNGDDATAEVLVAGGADVNARRVENGQSVGVTPLFVAVGQDAPSVALVERLLKHGARVDARRAGDASTPLHWAANFGASDAVHLLLRHGADPCALNRNGASALDIAIAKGHEDIADALAAIGGAGRTFDVLVTGTACHGGASKAKVTARTLDELQAAVLDASGSGLKHYGDVTVEVVDHDFADARVPLSKVAQLAALPDRVEVVVDWKRKTGEKVMPAAPINAEALAARAHAAGTAAANAVGAAHAAGTAAANAAGAAAAAAAAAAVAGTRADPPSPPPPASRKLPPLDGPTPRTRDKADSVYADFARGQARLADGIAGERARQAAALASALASGGLSEGGPSDNRNPRALEPA